MSFQQLYIRNIPHNNLNSTICAIRDTRSYMTTSYTAKTAAKNEHIRCVLQLICFGAEIDEEAIKEDKTELLRQIETSLKSFRDGNRMGTSLMSDEERRFMWNLGFVLAVKHPAIAFRTYQRIRSFVTFHGIFMGPGYDLGKESIWRLLIASESSEDYGW